MGVHNLKPTRQDVQGNPLHNVMDSHVGQKMVEEVWAILKEGATKMDNPEVNWEQAFRTQLSNYFNQLEHVWGFSDFRDNFTNEDFEEIVQNFLSDFEKIETEDTLYLDVANKEGLQAITEVSGNINLWSTGNTLNHPQATIILRHQISQLIHNAMARVREPCGFQNIITARKGEKIHKTLDFFLENNNAQALLIAVVDDDPEALAAITTEIETWKKLQIKQGKRIKVYVAPIRVMRGSHVGDPWPKDFPYPETTAENLHEVASIFDQRGEFAEIPREHRITFLDVDGTLSNDRLMKVRQMHVAYTHMMKAIKFATNRYTKTRESGVVRKDRLMLPPRKEIQRIYNAVLTPSPPRKSLSKVMEEINQSLMVPLDQETQETLTGIDTWLQLEGFLKPAMSANDVRKRYEELQLENSSDLKPECLLNGEADFTDQEFFQTSEKPIKPGEEDPDIERLISDKQRAKAEQIAEEFATEFIEKMFAKPEAKNIKLRKAAIKTRISVMCKLVEKVMENTDENDIPTLVNDNLKTSAREISDLIRGCLEVEGISESTAYDEVDRIATEITMGTLRDKIVSFKNYFTIAEQTRKKIGRESQMQGFKFVFGLTEDIPYELQVQTKRAAATGKINHDTVYKPSIILTEEQRDYIRKLTWAAHIMDLEEVIEKQGQQSLATSNEHPINQSSDSFSDYEPKSA